LFHAIFKEEKCLEHAPERCNGQQVRKNQNQLKRCQAQPISW
jgi:hypothetical protein